MTHLAVGADQFIWREPAALSSDLSQGQPPVPPFTFHQEDAGGRAPKVIVTDSRGVKWSVKWGEEAKPETFASRLLAAAGYMAEPGFFVEEGRIESAGALSRAAAFIDRSNGGFFRGARFQRRDNMDFHLLPTNNWSLDNNPFQGTRELNGLKVMMMLVSNWDVKDARNQSDSNTAIAEIVENGQKRLFYGFTDWGATMGRWGGIATRSKWDCKGYADQTSDFVKGVDANGMVGFGYHGKRREDLVTGVRGSDVAWLMQYLGRVTDAHLAAALQASGATAEDVQCFTKAIRARINQLEKVAASASAADSGTLSKR